MHHISESYDWNENEGRSGRTLCGLSEEDDAMVSYYRIVVFTPGFDHLRLCPSCSIINLVRGGNEQR